jgi:glycosyltransferase involved in cell wall biosynthesis
MKTSLVVPAYNEEKGLPLVVQEYQDEEDEIIIVDDGASDGTFQAAKQLVGGKVKLFRHGKNVGEAAALRTRVEHATVDIIIFNDVDYTYPAKYAPDLIWEIKRGTDLVLDARLPDYDNIPAFNRIGNNISSVSDMESNDLMTLINNFF